MKLSEDLAWRGLIKDKTFSEIAWLDEPKTFYHGVDASADSLTIGNLAALLLTRRLLESGWKTILLVGGATSLIGDPGGKTEERQLQSREEILKNVEALKKQVSNLFAGQDFTLVKFCSPNHTPKTITAYNPVHLVATNRPKATPSPSRV